MYSFDYKITPRQKDAILSTSILFRPSKHLRYLYEIGMKKLVLNVFKKKAVI